MEVEEREAWARGLPVVQERVPYSQVVALKKANELKHIIKHPQSSLQAEPERVFLVLKETSAEKYRRRGSKIPSGILLCGEPGSGKTLLAKAVAGEAGVSFFSVSASQFVEIFVGVGASRVRALYNEARENAPSVVFIDELDAVGRQRGLTEGSGGQERDATLNQLLTCLDGFEGRGDVITIAATNRPDFWMLPWCARAGSTERFTSRSRASRGELRFLRCTVATRCWMMTWCLSSPCKGAQPQQVLDDDVDFEAVAQVTDGMSGAELANVVDVAALRVLRENRSEITTDDMLQAAMLEEGGYPSPHEGSPIRQRQLALNEAALAVVAFNFRDFQNIQLITVVPRMTEEKGSVRYKLVDTQKMKANFISASCLRDFITVQLAPMVADEMWNGAEETCTIWADHADVARRTARQVALNGLSAPSEEGALYGIGVAAVDAPWRREAVDADASRILEECRTRAAQVGVIEVCAVGEGSVEVGASEEGALYGIGVAAVDAPWCREAVDADASRILEECRTRAAQVGAREDGALYGIGVAAVDAPWRHEVVDADATRFLEECRTRAAQVGVPQVGASQVGAAQVGVPQVGASQVGAAQVGVPQVGASQVGAAQVGASQVGAAQVGAAQVGAAQVGAAQVGVAQVGVAQVGVAQVGVAQVGVAQVGVAQVGVAQVGVAQVGVAQVGVAQVGVAQVGVAQTDLGSDLARSAQTMEGCGKAVDKLLPEARQDSASQPQAGALVDQLVKLPYLFLSIHPLSSSPLPPPLPPQILRRNRSLVDALVDKLMEEKAMGGEEFASLAQQYGSFDTPPPSPVEMRDRQLARFREAMMAGEKERAARVLLADPVAVE
ncbi:unnamed protein product [Closterium sp. Yama58-4]|nr:unnamed protein product [Closterium sp. Yama58-4]